MKHVFTDINKVAHLWANQAQDSARNSGNFYFQGDTIYSYGSHFPIAKHLENKKGEKAILFTNRSYSPTTAGHIRTVAFAANHLNIISCYRPDAGHAENFEHWVSDAEQVAKNLINARKPEKYLSGLDSIRRSAEIYASFFDISIPKKLIAVLSISDKGQYSEYGAKKIELALKEEKKRQKAVAEKHKKDLTEWLEGKSSAMYTRDGYDYLRVKDGRIETSQRVEIPLELGKRLWEQVKANTLSVGQEILHFRVSSIGKEIRIGCHNFKHEYLVKFGESVFVQY